MRMKPFFQKSAIFILKSAILHLEIRKKKFNFVLDRWTKVDLEKDL